MSSTPPEKAPLSGDSGVHRMIRSPVVAVQVAAPVSGSSVDNPSSPSATTQSPAR